MIKSPKPKLLVVRGSQPRMTEIDFYSRFKHFEIQVAGDKTTGWVVENKIPKNVKFIHLPLYPVWGFDPWTQIFGKYHAHRSFQFVKNLDKYIKDCDVINISDQFYFYCWQSALLAKKFHKKLVTVVWENIPRHITTYLPPYSFCVQTVLKQTDLFVARSNLAKQYLLSIGADHAKIQMIYKGIDTQKFIPLKSSKSKDKIVILYVGQLVKSKGIFELLTVFKKLHDENSNLELWLLGRTTEEPLQKMLFQISQKLPIMIKLQVPYDYLPKYYQQADIYCHLSCEEKYLGLFPGWNEWFSYAIIEAMASGLPIVATNCGGIPEQLGNAGNFVVEQKNVRQIYQALKKLIQNKNLRKNIGIRNRQRAETCFDIRTQAKKTEAAIKNIL